MKKVTFLGAIIVVVLSCSQVAFAQMTLSLTAEQQDAQQFYAALMDQTKPVPESLKKVIGFGREYVTAEIDYQKKKQETFHFLVDVADKEVNNPAQAKAVVTSVDMLITSLNALKKVRDSKFTTFNDRLNKNGLSQALQDALNESMTLADQRSLNDQGGQMYVALLDALNATKQFYMLLSKTKTKFATINSHFAFEDGLMFYDYWDYISKVRAAFQRATRVEMAQINVQFKYRDLIKIIEGDAAVQGLDATLKTDQSLDTIWNEYVPPAPQKDDGTFTLTVDDEITRRHKTDEKLSQLSSQIAVIQDDFNKYGTFGKDSVVSKASLQKAIGLEQDMVNLLRQVDKRLFEINIQYESEYPSRSNLIAESLSISDQLFRVYFASVQSRASNIDSPLIDVQIHKLLLANFGKYTSHFDNTDAPYKIQMKKPSAQAQYIKLAGSYNNKYELLFEVQAEYEKLNQPAAAPNASAIAN